MILDTSELLDLLPRVKEILDLKGKNYTAKLLKEFRNVASGLWYSDDYNENISSCFNSVEQEFKKQGDMLSLIPDDGSYYQSLHVIITPTTMFLNGPYPERSNRVIRKYASENHENFLRVTFRDENHLQYRFDREVDGPRFIRERVGVFLKNGLKIASRAFEFLAYSQSALKEHSVWYAGFNLKLGLSDHASGLSKHSVIPDMVMSMQLPLSIVLGPSMVFLMIHTLCAVRHDMPHESPKRSLRLMQLWFQ